MSLGWPGKPLMVPEMSRRMSTFILNHFYFYQMCLIGDLQCHLTRSTYSCMCLSQVLQPPVG